MVLHGIFHNISFQVVPGLHVSMSVAYEVLDVTPGNHSNIFRLKNKNTGKVLLEHTLPLEIPSTTDGRSGTLIQMNGVVFDSFAEYVGEVEIAGQVLEGATINVKQFPGSLNG